MLSELRGISFLRWVLGLSSSAMPCLKVINWLGKRKQKIFLFFKKKLYQSIKSLVIIETKWKITLSMMSLYSYSFDLPRHVQRNFMKRSMYGSSLVGTRTIGTRSRTIATYELEQLEKALEGDFTTVYHLQ